MSFSDRLREAMGGMTQAELARQTGVAQSMIARYLNGTHAPGYENLLALQGALPRLSSAPKAKARRAANATRSKTKG